MDKSEIIISGPEYTGPVLWGSIAEYFIPRMRSFPKDSICQVLVELLQRERSWSLKGNTKTEGFLVLKVDYATGESITTYEFLCKCLEIAEGLIELGLKRGEVVALGSDNSIPSIVTAMGVLMSGGILAPIDATLKSFERQHILKQLKPKYIICFKATARDFQKSILSINLNAKIIQIDSSDSDKFFSWNDIRTTVDVENYVPRKVDDPAKDIALISCSSGSTGMPKGIALSHSSILFTVSLTEISYIPKGLRALLFNAPLFWISGTIIMLTSSYFGFTRYVPKSTSLEHTLEAIEKCKPFILLSTPAILCFMTEHPNFQKYDLSSVKFLMSAGSVLGEARASKIMAAWKGVKTVDFYGLTETCGGIISSFGVQDLNSVGKLLPGVKVKVVDPVTGESLGPNKIGECRVKCKTLMRGYYNNEEETKAAIDEEGWFCTGDLFYYNEERHFYIVGRKKETIPYRNYEISPAEIEAYIIRLRGVKDVAIVPVPHEVDVNHLRALVVKVPESSITAQDIINGVKENFTERKHLKAGVQFVDALPRSEVGKLNRFETQKLIDIHTKKVYLDETEQ